MKLKSLVFIFLLTTVPVQADIFDFFNVNNFDIFSLFSPKIFIGLCVFIVTTLPMQLRAMEQRQEKKLDEKVKPIETKMKNCEKNLNETKSDVGRQKKFLEKMHPSMQEKHELNKAKIISLQELVQTLIETAKKLKQKKEEIFEKAQEENKQETGRLRTEFDGYKEATSNVTAEYKGNIESLLNHIDNVDRFLERNLMGITNTPNKPVYEIPSLDSYKKKLSIPVVIKNNDNTSNNDNPSMNEVD